MPTLKTISIKAPKDGYLISITAADHSMVQKMDPLCVINGEDEDRLQAYLKLSASFLALEEAVLSDDEIAKRRRILELNLQTAQSFQKFSSVHRDVVEEQFKLLLMGPAEVPMPAFAAEKGGYAVSKAMANLELFDFNVNLMKQKMALIQKQIQAEQAFLSNKQARLTIKAPITGTVSYDLVEGMFFQKGDVIATVERA